MVHIWNIFLHDKKFVLLLVRMSISLSEAGSAYDLCESKFCNYLRIHQLATLLLGKIGQIGTTFKARMSVQLISYEFKIHKKKLHCFMKKTKKTKQILIEKWSDQKSATKVNLLMDEQAPPVKCKFTQEAKTSNIISYF